MRRATVGVAFLSPTFLSPGGGLFNCGLPNTFAHFMRASSLKTVDPRTLTRSGRSTSGFHRPGRHRAHQARSVVKCSGSCMKGVTVGGAGGVLVLLLALTIWPLTTNPFRDEAPYLLLLETPPTFGRSLRVFGAYLLCCLP